MASLYENLLRDLLMYRTETPDATMQQQREFAREKLSTTYEQSSLTFGVAARIDQAIFGFEENTFWAQAYGNPNNGDVVQNPDGTFTGTAYDCGIFTIKIE